MISAVSQVLQVVGRGVNVGGSNTGRYALTEKQTYHYALHAYIFIGSSLLELGR
jgi:hypothetical protein